jgi:hypothetical protein
MEDIVAVNDQVASRIHGKDVRAHETAWQPSDHRNPGVRTYIRPSIVPIDLDRSQRCAEYSV